MPATKLAHGVTVRTFPLPPANFDPATASNRERAKYGIPRCPVEFPDLAERWERTLRRPFHIVKPVFRPMDYKKHHLIKRRQLQRLRGQHGPETTTIWSGGIVFPPDGDSMKWIEGTWTMPDASPPSGAQDGVWYSASTWIGIDGDDGSGDVLQAGCDADVVISGGVTQYQFNPWWEWYPAGSFWISNIPVSLGDQLNCLICVQANSTTTASIFLGNGTNSIGSFFAATAPTGTNLRGNCAEWIVEALEIDTGIPELAQYTPVEFTDCNAGTVGGTTVQAGSGNTINMVDGQNNLISQGQILGPTQVQVTYV